MDQIFNELSANGSYADKYAASSGMERVLRLSNNLGNCGFSRIIRVIEQFRQLPIAPNYLIAQWATDRSVGADRDLQRQLLTFTTRTPYIENFIANTEADCLIEFTVESQPSLGLGLAHLWGSFVLSLDSDVRFSQSSIDVAFHQLCKDGESKQIVSVGSVSSLTQVEAACYALQKRQIAGINNGVLLIEKLPTLFPYLALGKTADSQLSNLSGSEQFFQEIIRHFFILNATMKNWSAGQFDPQGLSWSSESETTLNQFSASRQFFCQDNKIRQFSLHTKINSANQRIYYFPDFHHKIVHIGYVGLHLQTTKFKA